MSDRFSEQKRSEIMRAVGSEDTSPEVRLRKALWHHGLRYRKHQSIEGIRPDIVFVSRQVAIFVDGCFWHGCPDHYEQPDSNAEFWKEKLETNRRRDRRNNRDLRELGWTVLRYWECEIREDLTDLVKEVEEAVSGS